MRKAFIDDCFNEKVYCNGNQPLLKGSRCGEGHSRMDTIADYTKHALKYT